MRSSVLAFLLSAVLVTPAWALSPAAEAFVRGAGLDPGSADVVAADKDGVIETTYRGDPATFSLEALALKKMANGVRSFVVTRKVIRELKASFASYKLPAGGIEGFDGLYLTPSERELMAKKIRE